jgi:hypothetical protein
MKTAKLKKALVVSRLDDGSISYKNVDLQKVVAGEVKDFVIKPGEIIFVPGSTTKTLGQGLLNVIPGIVLLM